MRRYAGVALVGLLIAGCSSPNPTPSATPRPTAAASVTQQASPSPSTQRTPAPTSTSTPAPSPTWQPVSQFGAPGSWTSVIQVAGGSAGYLAIGSEVPVDGEGRASGEGRYVMWASTDGLDWEEVAVPESIRNADLRGVVAAKSGGFVVFATGSPTFPVPKRHLLTSADGRGGWTELDLGTYSYGPIEKAAQGAAGYLFLEPLTSRPARLFYSSNGTRWIEGTYYHADTYYTTVYDVDAGDEGFVALARRTLPAGDHFELATASADGRTWLESLHPFGTEERSGMRLSALGPDWVAVRQAEDGSFEFWSSANGLDWARAGGIGAPEQFGWPPTLFSVGDELYFTPVSSAGYPLGFSPPPVWVSSDGATWRTLPMPGDAIVSGGVTISAGTLLFGTTVLGNADGRATFWIAP